MPIYHPARSANRSQNGWKGLTSEEGVKVVSLFLLTTHPLHARLPPPTFFQSGTQLHGLLTMASPSVTRQCLSSHLTVLTEIYLHYITSTHTLTEERAIPNAPNAPDEKTVCVAKNLTVTNLASYTTPHTHQLPGLYTHARLRQEMKKKKRKRFKHAKSAF